MPTININTGSGGGASFRRAIYVIDSAESNSGILDTSRVADQGSAINVSGLTNDQFRDRVEIYRNGIVLFKDEEPILTINDLQHDVARKTDDLKSLFFYGNFREGTVITLVVEDII